jgi:hypothetical protein
MHVTGLQKQKTNMKGKSADHDTKTALRVGCCKYSVTIQYYTAEEHRKEMTMLKKRLRKAQTLLHAQTRSSVKN